MSKKNRGLGRGLSALLGNAAEIKQLTNPDEVASSQADAPASGLKVVPVDLIQRGRFQPRAHFEPQALQELADSIRIQGVIQPIVLRPLQSGGYELIAGERRWRACQLAGLDTIPALVRELDDQTAAAISLIENIQREDLNPLEESRALQRLIDEFAMTHQEVADSVGRSRTAVTNLLRLRELNEDVKTLVDEKQIEMGHARALSATRRASMLWSLPLIANKARAWPISICFSSTRVFTSSFSSRRRNKLVTAVRERPTVSATS